MLNVIVLIAMAITAAAFAAGLTLQAGLPLLPVLIGTAALFLVMAASFLSMGRASRGTGASGDRLDELEEALEIIDTDLQRIDRVEDDISRLDQLSDRVDQLNASLAGAGGGDVTAELQDVYARIESLRAEVARVSGERGSGATAPQSLARTGFGTRSSAPPIPVVEEEIPVEIEPEPLPEPEPEPEPEPLPEPELILEPEPEPELVLEEPEPEVTLDLEPEPEPEVSEPEVSEPEVSEPEEPKEEETKEDDVAEEASSISTDTLVTEDMAEVEPVVSASAVDLLDDDDDDDERMLNIIREGIEDGRVDLYLQPTVTLPDRKVRYFEALTRIRKKDDTLVLPGEYMPVAKRSGLMPLIDNVLLVRSVQVLRRLGPDTRIKGVCGNVSMHSLLDPDYYPELIEFMEENSSLSENLVFEISQAELRGLTESELACLDTLGALGFTFCLDNIADIETDFSSFADRYFRHVKVSAEQFLGAPGRKASDLKRHLDGLGMQLVIEKVEKEGDVADLLDHGIELAQGYLFGEPQPMNAALSRELENAGAL